MTDYVLQRRLELFPNAPANINCKLCGIVFPNPILNGSSIASVVCPDCKAEMCRSTKKTAKKKSRSPKPKIGSSSAFSHVSSSDNTGSPNAGLFATSILPNSIQGWVE